MSKTRRYVYEFPLDLQEQARAAGEAAQRAYVQLVPETDVQGLPCTRCRALPGEPCTWTRASSLLRKHHADRETAWHRASNERFKTVKAINCRVQDAILTQEGEES
jgi:hypothetical protein